jgi:hypothetical protein
MPGFPGFVQGASAGFRPARGGFRAFLTSNPLRRQVPTYCKHWDDSALTGLARRLKCRPFR